MCVEPLFSGNSIHSIAKHNLFKQLLPPKAYLNNSSTSICTKFVHTSTNKIKFPVNVVAVSHFTPVPWPLAFVITLAFCDLQWTPEGRRVLTGSTSGEFTLWNGLTFNFETILQVSQTHHTIATKIYETFVSLGARHCDSRLSILPQRFLLDFHRPVWHNQVFPTKHEQPGHVERP